MGYNLTQWLDLRRKAVQYQKNKQFVEQHITLNVAQQYWKLLTDEEQTLGLKELANG